MFLKKELTEYNRYQAFAVHMAISLVIFFILLFFITQYWYPGILFDTGNGWKAIAMIVGIDLILGPVLTLIVFNPKKSSLKFDLTIIALVQTAALVYGTWTIHQTRPIALAFISSSFSTIFANNPLAKELIPKITNLETVELFYLFNDEALSPSLNTKQFHPYSQFSLQVKDIISPYRQDDLIEVDPLLSENRFIRINAESGKIIGFVKR